MLSVDVRNFLSFHGIRLNTDLGQHFLIDDGILEMIVNTAMLNPHDRVLEIGPGIGVLTRALLETGAIVDAVEFDERMIPLLHGFCHHSPALTVIQGNALHVPLSLVSPYRIVANIPYHITSPLLHRFLLETDAKPLSMTLLIQREVAENICSKKTASLLTLLVQLFGTPRLVSLVPPSAFLPPPKVDSAILHIDLFSTPPSTSLVSTALLLAKHAMSGRRKMLRTTLSSLPHALDALVSAGIDATNRPEHLTVADWCTLASQYSNLLS